MARPDRTAVSVASSYARWRNAAVQPGEASIWPTRSLSAVSTGDSARALSPKAGMNSNPAPASTSNRRRNPMFIAVAPTKTRSGRIRIGIPAAPFDLVRLVVGADVGADHIRDACRRGADGGED